MPHSGGTKISEVLVGGGRVLRLYVRPTDRPTDSASLPPPGAESRTISSSHIYVGSVVTVGIANDASCGGFFFGAEGSNDECKHYLLSCFQKIYEKSLILDLNFIINI